MPINMKGVYDWECCPSFAILMFSCWVSTACPERFSVWKYITAASSSKACSKPHSLPAVLLRLQQKRQITNTNFCKMAHIGQCLTIMFPSCVTLYRSSSRLGAVALLPVSMKRLAASMFALASLFFSVRTSCSFACREISIQTAATWNVDCFSAHKIMGEGVIKAPCYARVSQHRFHLKCTTGGMLCWSSTGNEDLQPLKFLISPPHFMLELGMPSLKVQI